MGKVRRVMHNQNDHIDKIATTGLPLGCWCVCVYYTIKWLMFSWCVEGETGKVRRVLDHQQDQIEKIAMVEQSIDHIAGKVRNQIYICICRCSIWIFPL